MYMSLPLVSLDRGVLNFSRPRGSAAVQVIPRELRRAFQAGSKNVDFFGSFSSSCNVLQFLFFDDSLW